MLRLMTDQVYLVAFFTFTLINLHLEIHYDSFVYICCMRGKYKCFVFSQLSKWSLGKNRATVARTFKQALNETKSIDVPSSADVVIIGKVISLRL